MMQPWDKQAIPLIEKAIRENSASLNPSSDGNAVRVTLPPLTEERRKEFIRLLLMEPTLRAGDTEAGAGVVSGAGWAVHAASAAPATRRIAGVRVPLFIVRA